VDSYGALILAGGSARRLGRVHKPGLLVGGVPILQRVLAAVPDASPRVVVGPPQPVPPDVLVVREDPPGGGPVAALSAGLPALVDADWVALLAGDLPFLTPAVLRSLRIGASGYDGAVLVDSDGRDQYLAGVYRVGALSDAVTSVGPPSGVPLRRVARGLRLARVTAAPRPGVAPPWLDCDDADDLRAAEAFARQASGQSGNRPSVGQKEADG